MSDVRVPVKNISVDAEAQELLQQAQVRLSQALGIRLTLTQTLKLVLRYAAESGAPSQLPMLGRRLD